MVSEGTHGECPHALCMLGGRFSGRALSTQHIFKQFTEVRSPIELPPLSSGDNSPGLFYWFVVFGGYEMELAIRQAL